MVHNYTRYSYTESFKKMLKTMEQEYCRQSLLRLHIISMIRMLDHILQMTQDSLRVSTFPETIMVCPWSALTMAV